MYKNTDAAARYAMETHHTGGEYYDDYDDFEQEVDDSYEKNICSECKEKIGVYDDRYLYEERCVCGDCLKILLFEEFSDDCRIRDET